MALVLRDEREGVRTLTLNRPEARNALTLDLLDALRAELAQAARDPVGCVVLTGTGSAFCAGGDIRMMQERQGDAVATMERMRAGLAELLGAMRGLDAPIVAKVQGDCIGAGLGLALACDMSYAAATARFGAPFTNLALVPDTALTWELPRRMGLSRAKEFVFTGELLQAMEAWEHGLINKVVPLPDLDDEVAQLSQMLAAKPTRALGQAKRALQLGADMEHASAVLMEAYAQGIAFTSEEHAEGVRAFLEKRPPEFRRRA
ncbi:MAG TPA: enoyl-CoA hydratase-related protein [Candidatus Thermoplasmatota archaeon]|jgi:2-(1,2-epoxy-1,2-dihydrophenyl)acetyl-CoA isomerase|nr:enoyl-CoA hydratase-related protein [Candidatus Thermoplasmatota archaeon]